MNIQAIEELIQGKVSSLRTDLDNVIEVKKKELQSFIDSEEAKLKVDCQDLLDALEFWKTSTTTTTTAVPETTAAPDTENNVGEG